MKKTVVCITLCLALSLIFSIGAEAASTVKSRMTLEKAVAVARENSSQAVIDKLDIKTKKMALKKAKEDAENLGPAYGYENLLNNSLTREVKVMEAEYNVTIAEMTAEENMKKLEQDVYKAFMNILLAQKDLELAIEKQRIASEKYKLIETRKNAGTATEEQLSNAEFDLYSKSLDIETKTGKLSLLDMELKRLLNLPYDSDMIDVKGTIEVFPFSEINIEALITEQKEAGLDVFKEECSVNLAERTLELTKEFFLPGSDIYEQNEMKLNAAYRNLETVKRNREVRIRNTYNELLNLMDALRLAEEYEKLQQKKLDNVQLRFDKGQVSKDQLLASKESCLDAAYRVIKAKYDASIKIYEFEALMVKQKK